MDTAEGMVLWRHWPRPPTVASNHRGSYTRPDRPLTAGNFPRETHNHTGRDVWCGGRGLGRGWNWMGREAHLSKSFRGAIRDTGKAPGYLACGGRVRGKTWTLQVVYCCGNHQARFCDWRVGDRLHIFHLSSYPQCWMLVPLNRPGGGALEGHLYHSWPMPG